MPDPSEQTQSTGCPDIDLLSRAGRPVGLSGTWRADDAGLYYLHQTGECLAWLGQSQHPGWDPGSDWSNVFMGTIKPDSTASGRWSDVQVFDGTAFNQGELTLRIEFDGSGADEQTYLVSVAVSGGFGAFRWVREDSLPEPREISGIFGASPDANCGWIETADGQRYEIGGPGALDMFLRPTPLSLQDYAGYVLFAPGDPIRAFGSVEPLLGSGCVESYVMASEYTTP